MVDVGDHQDLGELARHMNLGLAMTRAAETLTAGAGEKKYIAAVQECGRFLDEAVEFYHRIYEKGQITWDWGSKGESFSYLRDIGLIDDIRRTQSIQPLQTRMEEIAKAAEVMKGYDHGRFPEAAELCREISHKISARVDAHNNGRSRTSIL